MLTHEPDRAATAGVDQSILTYTGRYVCMADPAEAVYDIRDIAHALSQICRFGGHTRNFYSVAQHSVLVSQLVPVEYRLQALLHDAAEAYYGDVTSPMKQLAWMGEYRAAESGMLVALFAAFGVAPTVDSTAAVKCADLQMLATERRDLMAPDNSPWSCLAGIAPRPASISPLMPIPAEALFLKRFKELTGAM